VGGREERGFLLRLLGDAKKRAGSKTGDKKKQNNSERNSEKQRKIFIEINIYIYNQAHLQSTSTVLIKEEVKKETGDRVYLKKRETKKSVTTSSAGSCDSGPARGTLE
jgi:hypothetical protein